MPGGTDDASSAGPAPRPRGRARWLDLGLTAALLLIAGVILAPLAGTWTGSDTSPRPTAPSIRPTTGITETPGLRPSPTAPACARESLIGTLVAQRTVARTSPRPSARSIRSFTRISSLGAPQVFLLEEEVLGVDRETWFRALLPIRPNGTSGFIRGRDLRVTSTPFRLELDRRRFRLRLWQGCTLVRTMRVGIGTGNTPTPVGRFYLTSLFKLPDPGTVYGPYAYGLSGFSEVLRSWKLGGIIGLHGTNDPRSIGHRSSHGCIRLNNRDIRMLVRILPAGTPIEIR